MPEIKIVHVMHAKDTIHKIEKLFREYIVDETDVVYIDGYRYELDNDLPKDLLLKKIAYHLGMKSISTDDNDMVFFKSIAFIRNFLLNYVYRHSPLKMYYKENPFITSDYTPHEFDTGDPRFDTIEDFGKNQEIVRLFFEYIKEYSEGNCVIPNNLSKEEFNYIKETLTTSLEELGKLLMISINKYGDHIYNIYRFNFHIDIIYVEDLGDIRSLRFEEIHESKGIENEHGG